MSRMSTVERPVPGSTLPSSGWKSTASTSRRSCPEADIESEPNGKSFNSTRYRPSASSDAVESAVKGTRGSRGPKKTLPFRTGCPGESRTCPSTTRVAGFDLAPDHRRRRTRGTPARRTSVIRLRYLAWVFARREWNELCRSSYGSCYRIGLSHEVMTESAHSPADLPRSGE